MSLFVMPQFAGVVLQFGAPVTAVKDPGLKVNAMAECGHYDKRVLDLDPPSNRSFCPIRSALRRFICALQDRRSLAVLQTVKDEMGVRSGLPDHQFLAAPCAR